MGKDYYKTLGISPDASNQDIAKAFRVLAITYHPLKNAKNMAQANFKFCEICEAFEVLDTRKSTPCPRFNFCNVRLRLV